MSRSFFAPTPSGGAGDASTSIPLGEADGPSQSDSPRAPFLDVSDRSSSGSRAAAPAASATPSASVSGLPPILAYCSASILMTVVNKYVLSTHFSLNMLVLLVQSLVGVTLVRIAKGTGAIQIRELNARDVKAWLPISTLLVFVIWTGSKALQFLSIPVYTIFKNLTIILIAYGEVFLFNARLTRLIMLSFALMVLSSLIAASADISRVMAAAELRFPHSPDSLSAITTENGHEVQAYDPLAGEKSRIEALAEGTDNGVLDGLGGWGVLNSGYVWMALNCAFSAAYVLAMRKRIKVTGFKDWDSMFYNNLLSVPILIVMSFIVEDWSSENFNRNFPPETRQSLFTAIIFSGACAVFISYTTAWCIRATSSTTYSMVGALNKLPLALSGMVFFGDAVTMGSTSAISVGFLAGLVYAYAKNRQAEAAKLAAASGLNMPEEEGAKEVLPMHARNEGAKGRSD